MLYIDITTKQRREEAIRLLESFSNKTDVFRHFNVSYNTTNGKYLNELLTELGLGTDYYKKKRQKPTQYCLNCNKELDGPYKKKFCSRSCSAAYNNRLRECMSDETKNRISASVKQYSIEHPKEKVCYVYTCEKCGTVFETNKRIRKGRNIHCDACKRKHPVIDVDSLDTLLSVSKRTVGKILNRANKGCSICGWNESTCDIHHIKPKKNGGTDDMSNLILVCPNCHRVIHNTAKYHLEHLKSLSLANTFSDWKRFYYTK